MAEAPTPEELEAKRQELADIKSTVQEVIREKDEEAAARRRQEEWNALEREIAYEKQAAQLLVAPPSNQSSSEPVNEPPNNTALTPEDSGEAEVSNEPETEPESTEVEPEVSTPAPPQFSFGTASNDENGE